ncbi:hypothetical protein CLOM_g11227 [Closterium sp. NIES-68]|nr:hypothetical protein CLOM_g11227 [Closterium sp. NIES-68]
MPTTETAQLFVRYIISQHGIPTTLISDRDPKFTSKFWKELMSLLGTKLAMSSAYHPQTDGQTERLNQIVEQLLQAACKDEISKWDLHLPVLEFAYKNATHAATGQTLFFLYYGRHPLTPQKPTTSATVQPAHDFITTMHQLWDRTHKRLLDIQQQQKRQADRHRNDHTITIHNAFHVQVLKPYQDPNTIFVGRQPPPPPPVLVQNEPEYEVESVLAHRRHRNGTVELLIRWKGYDPFEDRWVPETDMGNARRPLHDYLRPRRDVRPPVRLTYGGRGKPNVVQAGSVVEQIEEDEIAHCYWAPIPEAKTREEALNGPNGEKHKYGPEGELTRYKSRLVARGFQQTKGKDYDEVFAPVGKGTTLRVLLAIAALLGWKIRQMDIRRADARDAVQVLQDG